MSFTCTYSPLSTSFTVTSLLCHQYKHHGNIYDFALLPQLQSILQCSQLIRSANSTGVVTLGPLAHCYFLSFYHIYAHIQAEVLVYIPKCSPFNILSNGLFYLPTYAFVYELHIPHCTSFVRGSKYQSSISC